MANDLLRCRVCGLPQKEPPWGEDGNTPNFEICPCCGTEFGYEDTTLSGVLRARDRWISGGAVWFSSKLRPPEWDLEDQLIHVPDGFEGKCD